MCEICGDYERLIASDLGMATRKLNIKQKKDKATQIALSKLTLSEPSEEETND